MSDVGVTGVVIQARMGSSRLPGKVAEPIGGLPALVLQLRRLAPAGLPVVVATSRLPKDDRVVELACGEGVDVVRGSELDVLERFAEASDVLGTEHVVRLTGDCPLTDPALVLDTVALHVESGADYTSNVLPRTYPKGLDVEVVRRAALTAAAAEATEQPDREHVLPFVYRRPERFRLANLAAEVDHSHERWTLDTRDDLERIRSLVADCADPIRVTLPELLERGASPPPTVGGGCTICADPSSSSMPGESPWVRRWMLVASDGATVARISVRTGPMGGDRVVEPIVDAPDVRAAARQALDSLLEGDQQVRP